MKRFYNFDGTTIGTSKAIALDRLPKTALATITKKYSFFPYSLKKYIEFENADNEEHFRYH